MIGPLLILGGLFFCCFGLIWIYVPVDVSTAASEARTDAPQVSG